MTKHGLHTVVVLLCGVLLLAGCTRESVPSPDGTQMSLTVRCHNPELTKDGTQPKDGERVFNENLIRSVDFLFYPSDSPASTANAVYRIRKELYEDTMTDGLWEVTFDMALKKDVINLIFTPENNYKATVYTLVNFDDSFIDGLSGTSAQSLAARRVDTDFLSQESNYVQSSFLMDGKAVLTYDENATPNVSGDIEVKRFAAKLSMAIHVADRVTLRHTDASGEPDEVWTPVLHTMRIFLVDGVRTVKLSHDGSTLPDDGARDPDPDFFSYGQAAHMRPFLNEKNVPYLNPETVPSAEGDKVYYHTWPMYSYPEQWSSAQWDYSQVNFQDGLPHEAPYIKLEMDWRRETDNGYSYDRRKYYYKVFMPLEEFKRNNWYAFYLDVAILGSETDEGKAYLTPSCYLLDWQNKSLAINKYAVISKARYLSVDKSSWVINNLETLTGPFMSSHNVQIVTGSVKASRPFYGELTGVLQINTYNEKLHAWIRQNEDGSHYLDYTKQDQSPYGDLAYEPSKWLSNTSTAIVLNHPLENNYEKDDFDYSPYTIEFDIIHTDLADEPTSTTYAQYLRHISITQYPAIYIEATRNSDDQIIKIGGNNPYGYADGEMPWSNKPWGYVYVNGGRFVRWDNKQNNSSDPFFQLATANNKREYQWQTVWYTGGSRDLFNIHVTVLPKGSSFVIGDPREDQVNNLDDPAAYPGLYEFTVDGSEPDKYIKILETLRSNTTEYVDGKRTGFNKAAALYGEDRYRPLTWYYPTEKTTRTENMLAPSYRIASKFGGTEYGGAYFGDITKAYAEYRCAAYQEDGFPAGRWRLPTKAEIHFIAQLSAKKAFERLFSNSVYWSATGAVSVNGDNGTVSNSTQTTALLRCVYDSWYWDQIDGQEGDPRHNPRTQFVWGDKER